MDKNVILKQNKMSSRFLRISQRHKKLEKSLTSHFVIEGRRDRDDISFNLFYDTIFGKQ